jgi:hypothetical protein
MLTTFKKLTAFIQFANPMAAPGLADKSRRLPNLPWHSNLQPVYHTHPACDSGRIAHRFRSWPGTDGKPHCAECARLEAADASQGAKPELSLPFPAPREWD